MSQPPLNPDGIEAGAKAMYNEEPWRKNPYSTEHISWAEIQEEDRQVFREEAEVAVSAYLAVAQPVAEGGDVEREAAVIASLHNRAAQYRKETP